MDGLIVHDVRNANSNIHFRVIGSLLRSNLRSLHAGIHNTVVETFAAEFMSGEKAADGKCTPHDKRLMRGLLLKVIRMDHYSSFPYGQERYSDNQQLGILR